ncbi:MAG: aminoacyl-tRNA deacylase [Burkholderiaceae bacterium]
MGKKHSVTRATQVLKKAGIAFCEHPYSYVDHGGAGESARQLGVGEHVVVKTLVMQDEARRPLLILMHGDCNVSTKNLAREIGCKSVEPCVPADAERHSGYQVGGTSPFGLRKAMPIYVEASVLDLPEIYINGGRRGMLVSISPASLVETLSAKPVNCALAD